MNRSRLCRTLRGRIGATAAPGVAVPQPFFPAVGGPGWPRSTTGAQRPVASGSVLRLLAARGGGSWLVTTDGQGYEIVSL